MKLKALCSKVTFLWGARKPFLKNGHSWACPFLKFLPKD